MLLDTLCQLDAAHAYTATGISTNVMDLGPVTSNTTRDLGGGGEPLYLTILVTTTVAATGGASSATFSLESDDNTSLSSATVHWTGAAVAKATLVAGYFYAQAVPLPSGAYERYVGIRIAFTTNDWTSGAVSAWIHAGRFDTRVYASGITNSV